MTTNKELFENRPGEPKRTMPSKRLVRKKVVTLGEMLKAASLKLAKNSPDPVITRLAIDSRRVVPGSLFFALPGLKSDGNRFIDEAIARGAVAVISNQDRRFGGQKVAFVKSLTPRLSLAKISRAFFGYPDRALSLIGVTGTNGKTTVTGLLKGCLLYTSDAADE